MAAFYHAVTFMKLGVESPDPLQLPRCCNASPAITMSGPLTSYSTAFPFVLWYFSTRVLLLFSMHFPDKKKIIGISTITGSVYARPNQNNCLCYATL